MPAGQTRVMTARYGARITTVDPSQGYVEGVMKGDAAPRRFAVYETPVAFRWPQVGEAWMVEQKNGTWYLCAPWPDKSAPNTPQTINSGELVLNAPEGVLHIQGSGDGSSDFSIRKSDFLPPPKRGSDLSFKTHLRTTLTHNGVSQNHHLVAV